MTPVIEKDVNVVFKRKGVPYGEERYVIKVAPGENFENLLTQRVEKSRYAIEGVEFELEISCKDIAA